MVYIMLYDVTCVVVHVLGAAGAASEEDAAPTGGTGEKEGRKE
jgi:hypothetical protein